MFKQAKLSNFIYLDEIILTSYKNELLNKTLPQLIKETIDQGIPVIALTEYITGNFNKIDKIEASLMLSSYFETVGFKNGQWEFNYGIVSNTFDKYMTMWNILLHHYLILGGPTSINIKDWFASDDTILIIATAKAVIKNGGLDNYIDEYVNSYDSLLVAERASGKTTLNSIKL